MKKGCIFALQLFTNKPKTMTTIQLGNIGSKDQAEKIALKLNGKTYFDFIVSYSSDAGNYPVVVSTERSETTEDELKNMVLFVLACEL